ncbi:SMP-30/gluconolactonase/LRE family protein [Pelagibius sp. CAU 1746]|uniref:SMP-30/gluconolactonase/LRE family protein n=1 Tax=Pelagibius sp. CAU 1746 TaxID=3140370 RepID=UPI00325A4C09
MKRLEHPRLVLGESARWLPAQGRFAWMDLMERRLFFAAPDGGSIESVAVDAPGPLGALLATGEPERALLTCATGLASLDLSSGAHTPVMPFETGREGMYLNDAGVDAQGRIWLGSYHVDEAGPFGVLYCCNLRTGTQSIADSGFIVPNGPAVSADGKTLFFSSSFERTVLAYDIDPAADRLVRRRVHIRFDEKDGLPDGLACDAEGCLWVAHWEGACVTRHAPDGAEISRLSLPTPLVTSVAFGGEDMRSLLITTASVTLDDDALASDPDAGSVFIARVESPGAETFEAAL